MKNYLMVSSTVKTHLRLLELCITSDCNFTITSTEEESSSHSRRLALIIDYQNDTELITAATTFNSSTNLTDAVVFYRSTDQPVNSSFCHIASLEVYRGRDQAIKIRHYGFSLSQRGTIEVIDNYVKIISWDACTSLTIPDKS